MQHSLPRQATSSRRSAAPGGEHSDFGLLKPRIPVSPTCSDHRDRSRNKNIELDSLTSHSSMEVCFLDSANFALVGVAGESRLRGDHEHRTFTLPSRTCVFLQSTRLKAVWGSDGGGAGEAPAFAPAPLARHLQRPGPGASTESRIRTAESQPSNRHVISIPFIFVITITR